MPFRHHGHEANRPKRRRFFAGLIEGKSMRQAALAAGYTESMAHNASIKILPGARAEFGAELAKKIPLDKLVARIAEGLRPPQREDRHPLQVPSVPLQAQSSDPGSQSVARSAPGPGWRIISVR